MLNEDAEDTLTATQVAKTFNMTVFHFNEVLRDLGIQYRKHGRWNISDDLAHRDFVRMRTHVSYSLKGMKKVKHYMTWTMSGLHYLNARLGYPNFCPPTLHDLPKPSPMGSPMLITSEYVISFTPLTPSRGSRYT